MKTAHVQLRMASAILWLQALILFFAFPAICSATPAAPATLDLYVTNSLLLTPGSTPTTPQVTLYWSNSAGAVSYQVYRGTTSNGPYPTMVCNINAMNTAPIPIPTCSDSMMLVAGTTYYYVAYASDNTSQSATHSPEMKADTTIAPQSVSASPVGTSGQVNVSWQGTSGINYTIYAASSTSEKWVTLKSAIPGTSSAMSYLDAKGPAGLGLYSGTTYYYAVAALGSPNNLSETDSASVSALYAGVPPGPQPPQPPNITVTTSGSTATVSLTWNSVPGATGYNIVRSTSPTAIWNCTHSTCLLSTPQSGTTFIDSAAASGTIEYYAIVASDDGGSTYGPSNPFGVSTSITTVSFATTAAGTSGKAVSSWTYDVKQDQDPNNLNNAIAAIQTDVSNAGGASMFTGTRVAWYPQYPLLLSNTALDPIAQSQLDQEALFAGYVEHTSGTFLGFFLSPKTGGLDTCFYDTCPTPSAINVTDWVNAMQLSRDYYLTTYASNGASIAYNGIENEPDNTSCQFTSTTFGTILNSLSNWGSTVQEGPDTFRAGDGALWLGATSITGPQPKAQNGSLCESSPYTQIQNTSPSKITKASTHVIGGTPLADFKTFLAQARETDNLPVWLTEMHSLAEPLVALNYYYSNSMKQGIARAVWWSPITTTRGDFMQISKSNNQISNQFAADGLFAVASVYLNGTGTTNNGTAQIVAFIANNALDPSTFMVPIYETFTLTCTDKAVSFNGGGATHSYSTTVLSADKPDGEFEILVTW